MPSEEDRTVATGNMHKSLVKFSRVVFELCEEDRQTDRQTDRRTDILITIFGRGGAK